VLLFSPCPRCAVLHDRLQPGAALQVQATVKRCALCRQIQTQPTTVSSTLQPSIGWKAAAQDCQLQAIALRLAARL